MGITTELAAGQPSRFLHKGPVASKLAGSKPSGISRVGAMLEAYCKLKTKLKTIAELKEALQVIWGNLSQGPIDKAVKDFSKRPKSCVGTGAGHFEHSL